MSNASEKSKAEALLRVFDRRARESQEAYERSNNPSEMSYARAKEEAFRHASFLVRHLFGIPD
jgi:hypothetical protein